MQTNTKLQLAEAAPVQSSEPLIRKIYAVTSAHDKGFDYQLKELLRIGLERFSLDIGILSRIVDDTYTVVNAVAPDEMGIKAGSVFEYANTYCQITCSNDTTLAMSHVGEDSVYNSHPAYKALGLEAYIGIPIRKSGEIYGTLNFSSAAPHPRKFDTHDIDAMLLMASWIETELVRREQEIQLKELNHKLENEVLLDSLTKVPNRRGMRANLQRELSRLVRTGGRATLALIDLDHFKALNDQHGHLAGDQALVATAATIEKSIRGYDYLARFGGEEFILLLPDTSVKLCSVVCERILKNIAEQEFSFGQLTASAGSFQIECTEIEDTDIDAVIDNAIACADAAMYAAKAAGRNRHVIFGQHND